MIKISHTHTHRQKYSATGKKEILTFEIRWTDSKCIMLSVLSRTKTNTICMISLTWGLYKTKHINTRKRLVIAKDESRGGE